MPGTPDLQSHGSCWRGPCAISGRGLALPLLGGRIVIQVEVALELPSAVAQVVSDLLLLLRARHSAGEQLREDVADLAELSGRALGVRRRNGRDSVRERGDLADLAGEWTIEGIGMRRVQHRL